MGRSILILGEALFVAILCSIAVVLFHQHSPAPDSVRVDVKLPDSRAQVYLHRDDQGRLQYLVSHPGGKVQTLSADELAEQLYVAGNVSGVASLLGASSKTVVLWLGIGFFGQILFTGRMVVQWLASERKGTSVVPPIFWWMSLVGSLTLLAYFLWRRDPIGLLGQAFGSFIYLKNILWILEGRSQPALAPSPAEPAAQP
jgi:lipid-A-disaccharide synthase-like uncharacterized protein